jgi:regulator of replication initiation timing
VDQSALIEQLFAEIKALKERMLVLENVEKENVVLRNENAVLREKLFKYENQKQSK